MENRKLNCEEMVKKFEDYFCEDKSVYVFISSKTFKTSYFVDKFEVYDLGDTINMHETSGTECVIYKNSIVDIFLSPEETDEILTLQTNNEVFSFLIV